MMKSPENPEIPEKDIEKGKRIYGLETRYDEKEVEARWNKINADLSVFVHDLKQMEKTNPEIAKSGLAKLDNMLNVYVDIIETPEKLDPKTKEKLSNLTGNYKRVIKTVREGKELEAEGDLTQVIGCLGGLLSSYEQRKLGRWMVEDAGYILGPEELESCASNAAYVREAYEEEQRESLKEEGKKER